MEPTKPHLLIKNKIHCNVEWREHATKKFGVDQLNVHLTKRVLPKLLRVREICVRSSRCIEYKLTTQTDRSNERVVCICKLALNSMRELVGFSMD